MPVIDRSLSDCRYDISGRPVAFDSRVERLKVHKLAAAAGLGSGDLVVAEDGDERHAGALSLLSEVLWDLRRQTCWRRELRLSEGDVAVADSTVLLRPCPPAAVSPDRSEEASGGGPGSVGSTLRVQVRIFILQTDDLVLKAADLLLKADDFLLKTDDFLLNIDDFILKNVDFYSKMQPYEELAALRMCEGFLLKK